jgi:hypothetical protein
MTAPVIPPVPIPASNTFKALIRSLMPFVYSGAAALIAHFGYHVSNSTVIQIVTIGFAGLTIVLHAAESQWPWVGVFLGYVGAPVYAPVVSQTTQIAQLEALVAALITQLNTKPPVG